MQVSLKHAAISLRLKHAAISLRLKHAAISLRLKHAAISLRYEHAGDWVACYSGYEDPMHILWAAKTYKFYAYIDLEIDFVC